MNNYPYTGKRIGATFIDYTLLNVLTIPYIVYFGETQPDGTQSVHGFQTLPIFAFWFFYFVVMEWLGGTLGHRAQRLKVVTMDGAKPGFSRIFRRRICDPLDLFFFGLLAFLLVRNTPRHQRLGDLFAKTQVIGQHDMPIAHPHPE